MGGKASSKDEGSVDYLAHLHDSMGQLLRHGWFRSLCIAGLSTLSLGCMGSAVLPLAATFASTGILVGFLTIFLVCAVNVYTSRMLLRQARVTGAYDYESLGHLVAGFWWQKFVEFSNWILLFGTIVGGIAQLSEAGSFAVRMLWCEPGMWLLGPARPDGSDAAHVLVILYILILVLPWSFLKEMQELEYAGFVGYPIVLWMAFSIVHRCIQQGFPAITSGLLPAVGFTGLSHVAASVSTWAFAFYIQPIMMPYYAGQPPGNVGMHATGIAVNGVLCGTALLPYILIGFFGAALWGPAAAETGNVLTNDIYGQLGPEGQVECPARAQGALNIAMTVYLAVTIPPIEFSLRHIVNTWVSQLRKRFKLQRWIPKRDQGKAGWARNVVISVLNLTFCTLLALVAPDSSVILTITGATGVLLVSFVIPIVNHFLLLTGRARCQRDWIDTKGGMELPDCLNMSPRLATCDEEEAVDARPPPDAAVRVDSAAPATADDTAAGDSSRHVSPFLADEEGTDCPMIPASAAWGSMSATAMTSLTKPTGSSVRKLSSIGRSLSSKQELEKVTAALSKITRVDPESFLENAPVTNMHYAFKLAAPLSYRTRERGSAMFWAVDVVAPLLVLVFGVFCSICTLAGVTELLASEAAAAV